MGTTVYFDHEVEDAVSKKGTFIELGTTNFAGAGPQMYLQVGDEKLILSQPDAKALCEATASVARYLGHDR